MLTGHQRSRLESEAINFFKHVIACHHDNQLRFATVLCDVMKTVSVLSQGQVLSGFMRRLLLQVLLEDERILVGVQSHKKMCHDGGGGGGGSGLTVARHPRCGAGHKYRAVLVSLNSTCSDVISKVTG